jgi:hypothetical protein
MKSDDAPKSAYEIAMEKLRRQDRDRGETTAVPLSDEQKLRIADIRRKHEARLAEREILFRSERAKAAASEEAEALEKVEREYSKDRQRIEAQRERDIAAVRGEGAAGGGPGAASPPREGRRHRSETRKRP